MNSCFQGPENVYRKPKALSFWRMKYHYRMKITPVWGQLQQPLLYLSCTCLNHGCRKWSLRWSGSRSGSTAFWTVDLRINHRGAIRCVVFSSLFHVELIPLFVIWVEKWTHTLKCHIISSHQVNEQDWTCMTQISLCNTSWFYYDNVQYISSIVSLSTNFMLRDECRETIASKT